MTISIPLNVTNLVAGTTNTYTYRFTSVNSFYNQELFLVNANLFRSWNNITAAYTNNSYTYTWIDGTVINVVMPDGIYSIDDISNYLQAVMTQQGHYLIDNASPPQNHYYLNWETNATYYKVQLNALLLPASLPSGWSYGTGLSPAWTTSALCPQVTLTSLGYNTLSFGSVVGFNSGTYPSVNTATASILSQFTPTLEQVLTIFILCNLAFTPTSVIPSSIYNFPASGYSSSATISIVPPSFLPIDCSNASSQTLTLSLVDQLNRPIQQLDPNASFVIGFRTKTK